MSMHPSIPKGAPMASVHCSAMTSSVGGGHSLYHRHLIDGCAKS